MGKLNYGEIVWNGLFQIGKFLRLYHGIGVFPRVSKGALMIYRAI